MFGKIFDEKLKNCYTVKISEVTTSFSGGTPKVGVLDYYNGNIPFIRSGEIHNSFTEIAITQQGLESSSAKLVKKGDLLYALYGATSGEVDISKINGAINQAILCIRSDIINIKYLAYWLEYSKNDIISRMLQGGQGNLSAELVKSLKFPIPSNDVQDLVVLFLNTLDRYIDSQKKILNELENTKRSLMQQLFI